MLNPHTIYARNAGNVKSLLSIISGHLERAKPFEKIGVVAPGLDLW